MEPISVSAHSRASYRLDACACYILSWSSIDSDPVAFPPRLGGDFSGDEKMPEMGSRPCSSYTPLSASVMPVFLCTVSDMRVCLWRLCAVPSLDADIVVVVFAAFAFACRRHVWSA
jgi:hypothetical protein